MKEEIPSHYFAVVWLLFAKDQKYWIAERGRNFPKYDINIKVDYINEYFNGAVYVLGFDKSLVDAN